MGVQESEVIYENCPFTKCQWSAEVLSEMAQQQQQQQYRDPPPYPGHSKQVLPNQPGLRQSFSGSETSTDVSLSSTENLATWQRQEPQGEETQAPLYQQLDDSYSILARLGMPPGAIESKGSSEIVSSSTSSSSSSSSTYYTAGSQAFYSYPTHSQSIYATSPSLGSREEQTHVYGSGGSSRQTLAVPSHWQAHGLPPPQSGHYSRSLTPTYHHPHPYVNQHWTPGEGDGSDLGAVPTTQQLPYISTLPPPPEYPGSKVSSESGRLKDCGRFDAVGGKVELARSQPDLTGLMAGVDVLQPLSQKKEGLVAHGQLGCHAASEPVFSVLRSGSGSGAQVQQVIELLSEENRKLQAELAHCYKKVSKLQKFEMEIQKVHEAYESLVKSSQKRERLEAALKTKLDEEVKKLRTQNEELRAQVQQTSTGKKEAEDAGVSSIQRKPQHQVLDAKLAATQSSLSRLQDEVRKKDAQMVRMEKLQKAFNSLQTTSERREEMEKQLRSRLERELETFKSGEKRSSSDTSATKEDTKSITALKKVLNEKETKILQLETEIVRWEQRYIELQAVQQIEENRGPQQAHLAALEKSSAETEKLIDEAKTEKLRHMEELYQSNRRVAELEAKVKWLHTQLQEKEAMVKVYQRAPTLPRSSSVHAICCSPHHSPRPSLIASTAYTRPSQQTSTSGAGSGGYCDFVEIKHVKTGSTSALETGRKMSLDDALTSRESFPMTKSDSEDETRLWQV